MMSSNPFYRIILVLMLAISAAGSVQAADHADSGVEIESSFSGEVRFIAMQSRDKKNQDNLLTKEVYLQYAFASELSAFAIAYHDNEFESAYLGVAKQLGNFQVALGAGAARYDDLSHFVFNPWVYYQNDLYTGLLTIEHYNNESEEPWYYKGYIQRMIYDRYYVGAFGEKDIGIGPMLGVYFGSQVNVWASVPAIYRPSEGGMKSLLGLTLEF